MAGECFTLLDKNHVERSTVTIKLTEDESPDFAFLEQIITPVYNIVAAVRNLLSSLSRIWKRAPCACQVSQYGSSVPIDPSAVLFYYIQFSYSDIMGSCRRLKIVNTEKRHTEAGGIMMILTSISGKIKPSSLLRDLESNVSCLFSLL